jgi:hypothetical protein
MVHCLALAALAVTASARPAGAQADWRNCRTQIWADSPDPAVLEAIRAAWRSNGRPVLRPEQRLANGVAWRLVVDQRSELAVPRITWMPDREAMARANGLFEALQGCRAAPAVEGIAIEYQAAGSVALTYASPRLVSAIEIVSDQGNDDPSTQYPIAIGSIFDLERGRILTEAPCRRGSPPRLTEPFRLDDLLDTCAEGAHERFLALWERAAQKVVRSPAYRRDTGPDGRYCEARTSLEFANDANIGLYLTPSGLAVRVVTVWPRAGRLCAMRNSPYDTVIIPWRELEPFLKPGPWRDELLGRKG